MANRAYLYCRDIEGCHSAALAEHPPLVVEDYYDSRHNIPYAWFFLFAPEDIKMVDIYSPYLGGAHWQEPRFCAPKAIALERLGLRRLLLLKIADHRPNAAILLDDFVSKLGKRDGSHLLLDPSEVFGGRSLTDEEEFDRCSSVLRQIGAAGAHPNESIEQLVSDLNCYSDLNGNGGDKFELNFIGYTYF